MNSSARHTSGMTIQIPKGELYDALARRDRAYDGLFIVAVKTTGIYCRPTCTAKKPRPENVEYFDSPTQAESAGYRACKRCRPKSAPGEHPAWAQRLLDSLDHLSASDRLRDDDLRREGLEPATVRRYFLNAFGMSFHAYQRAARLGLAQRQLANGRRTLDVAFVSGFESDSGFRDAFKRHFGVAPSKSRTQSTIHASWINTPIGVFWALADASGVLMFEFADRRAIAAQTRAVRRDFRAPIVPGVNESLERLRVEMGEYFAGKRREFSVPLSRGGTEFQRRVWAAVEAIPFGETRSYDQIATKISAPESRRAVGLANGANRLPILIPCHRVVRKDGSLCGYGGGLWRKQWLLEHEQRVVANRINAAAQVV